MVIPKLRLDLDLSVYQLFHALYSVKGEYNATPYEKNVCNYYANEIRKNFKDLGFKCNVTITNRFELRAALENYYLVTEIYDMVRVGIDNDLNFTVLEIPTPFVSDIRVPAFTEWANSAKLAIQSLPSDKMYYGNKCKLSLHDFLYPANRKGYTIMGDSGTGVFTHGDSNAQGRFVAEAARSFCEKNPTCYISASEVKAAHFAVAKGVIEEQLSKQRRKRALFWVGFGIWATAMFACVFFTFMTQTIDLPILADGNVEGFWANVLNVLVADLVIGAVTLGGAELYNRDTFMLFELPMVPKGVCSVLAAYMMFGTDVVNEMGSHDIPFYIFAGGCLALTVVLEIVSLKGEEFDLHDYPGAVFYSSLVAAVPVVMMAVGTAIMCALHIVAAWFIAIIATIGFLIGVIGLLIFFFDID